MVIPPERAFWLLHYYKTREMRLTFGGRILGEEAACTAVISHVWNEIHAIGIKLLSDDGGQSWDRLISLSNAKFLLAQIGDPDFQQFAKSPFHSVLVFRFPDGSTMFLGEQ